MSKAKTELRPGSTSSKLTAGKGAAAARPGPRGETHVLVRNLLLNARIGLHQHERLADQRIRVNLDLAVDFGGPVEDDYDKVVCYGELVTGLRRVVGAGHVNLVETLAERVAEMCLTDRRVLSARVRIEKLDVFPEAEAVGIEIERFQVRM
jgi:7,8-dihydroneopterin aldolase/epimerase/oxygenase